MFSKPQCPVIAIEEHYWDEELAKTYVGGEAGRPGEQQKRLYDFGPLRIKEMDDVGIDMQVISLGAPSTQKLPAETAAALTRRVNDRLHAQVAKNPQRFAAFAGLPTAVPDAAADVSLRQLLVPIMLFDGDDRAMRFTKHLCSLFRCRCACRAVLNGTKFHDKEPAGVERVRLPGE